MPLPIAAIGSGLSLFKGLSSLFGKKKKASTDTSGGIMNLIQSLIGGGDKGGFFSSPGGAAAINALGSLAGGIGAGFGSASERKWAEEMLGKKQDWSTEEREGGQEWQTGERVGSQEWQDEMRDKLWGHQGELRGELEKRLAPTQGYIGMSPHLQGDVTKAIMGNLGRYIGGDVMKKYGIDLGGYASGEKLAKPEAAYMYREKPQGEPEPAIEVPEEIVEPVETPEEVKPKRKRPNRRDFGRFARRRFNRRQR